MKVGVTMSTEQEVDRYLRRGPIGAALARAYGAVTNTRVVVNDVWFTLGRESGGPWLAVIMHTLGGEVRSCRVRHLEVLLGRKLTADEAAFFQHHASSFQLPLAELSAQVAQSAREAVDRHIRNAQQTGIRSVLRAQTHLGDVRVFWVYVPEATEGHRYLLAVYGPVGLLRELMQAHSKHAGGSGMHVVMADAQYHIRRDEFGPRGLAERRILIDVAPGS